MDTLERRFESSTEFVNLVSRFKSRFCCTHCEMPLFEIPRPFPSHRQRSDAAISFVFPAFQYKLWRLRFLLLCHLHTIYPYFRGPRICEAHETMQGMDGCCVWIDNFIPTDNPQRRLVVSLLWFLHSEGMLHSARAPSRLPG